MEVELFNPDGYNYTDVRPGTAAEDRYYIRNAAKYTEEFIAAHWPEEEWELMWFVNPPVSSSFSFFREGFDNYLV